MQKIHAVFFSKIGYFMEKDAKEYRKNSFDKFFNIWE